MADKGNITNKKVKGEMVYTATYGEQSEDFQSFAEASRWLEQFTDTAEPAASEMTEAQARKINGDVRQPSVPGVKPQTNPVGNEEHEAAGSGNSDSDSQTEEGEDE